MPCLNVDLDYFSHPKTVRLVGLLGRGAAELPLRLWAYCGKFHCVDGYLAGYSPEEIEAQVLWWGKPGVMVAAMERVGFIVKMENGWRVHDWADHQGHIAAYKVRGKAAAESRWNAVRDATGIALSNAKGKDKQYSYGASLQNQRKGEAAARAPDAPPDPDRDPMDSVGHPSLEEVLTNAQMIGLAAWKAKDTWEEQEACGWKDHNGRTIVKWRPFFTRVKSKWEADGRPSGPPANKSPKSETSLAQKILREI